MRPVAQQPWTLGRLLTWTTEHFAAQGCEAPRLEAEILLAHARGCKRIELYTRFDEVAEDSVRSCFRDLVRRRLAGCPVAYLVGHKEFFSLQFAVNPAVLIPRPDTETLVMACLEVAAKEVAEKDARILEIGTGSGAVAVALAKHLPRIHVTATDISAEALEVARGNACRHGVADRIRFLHGDLFQPVPAQERFAAVLSNPPYVSQEELPNLPRTVRDFEPLLALDGGPDGLDLVRKLIAQAPQYLSPGGWLLLEAAPHQIPAVEGLLRQTGFAVLPHLCDSAGRPRVARGRWMS
jgi:release factor glutamine methyltransferase